MDEECRQFRRLRARVQARMEAITRQDGEAWTWEDQRHLCCALMSLGYGAEGGPMRVRATVEDTLEMEDYLAWAAATFADEIAALDALTTALVQRLHAEDLDADARDAVLTEAMEAFVEGTDDPNQLPLFP